MMQFFEDRVDVDVSESKQSFVGDEQQYCLMDSVVSYPGIVTEWLDSVVLCRWYIAILSNTSTTGHHVVIRVELIIISKTQVTRWPAVEQDKVNDIYPAGGELKPPLPWPGWAASVRKNILNKEFVKKRLISKYCKEKLPNEEKSEPPWGGAAAAICPKLPNVLGVAAAAAREPKPVGWLAADAPNDEPKRGLLVDELANESNVTDAPLALAPNAKPNLLAGANAPMLPKVA